MTAVGQKPREDIPRLPLRQAHEFRRLTARRRHAAERSARSRVEHDRSILAPGAAAVAIDAVLHSVCGGPPLAAIFSSFCCAKYAMNRLSGDQNGNAASSVPGSGCAVSESMGRIHNRTLPDASRAVNASLLPSGEMTTLVPVRLEVTNVVFSGGYTKNRVTDGVIGRDADHQAVAPATVVSASSAAAACHTREAGRVLLDPASASAGVDRGRRRQRGASVHEKPHGGNIRNARLAVFHETAV